MSKKAGRPRLHESNSAKTKSSQQKWLDAGNTRVNVWCPDNAKAKQALKEFAAQLRRDYGTFMEGDLIL